MFSPDDFLVILKNYGNLVINLIFNYFWLKILPFCSLRKKKLVTCQKKKVFFRNIIASVFMVYNPKYVKVQAVLGATGGYILT